MHATRDGASTHIDGSVRTHRRENDKSQQFKDHLFIYLYNDTLNAKLSSRFTSSQALQVLNHERIVIRVLLEIWLFFSQLAESEDFFHLGFRSSVASISS